MRSDLAALGPRAAPPLVIEFVGLPGAGKSTVATVVAAMLRAHGRPFVTRQGIGTRRASRVAHLARLAAFTARRPEPTLDALRAAWSARPLTPVRLRDALRLSLWASRLADVGCGDADLVLLDQGVVQQAWTVLVGATRRDDRLVETALRALVAGAPVDFAFVHVDVDVEVAAERVRARPTMLSHFDHMAATDARRMLAAHRDDLWRLLACAIGAADAPCLTVHGDATPAELAREILHFIDTRGPRAPGARSTPGGSSSGLQPRTAVTPA